MADTNESVASWRSVSFENCFDRLISDREQASARYQTFYSLFNRNFNRTIVAPHGLRIPSIVHQIWLGGKLPKCYKDLKNSWIINHPGWSYKLWMDHDISMLRRKNDRYFREAFNFGEKADILRYEILFEFGGLYADLDVECLRPLDTLLAGYDFVAGIEPLDTSPVILGNAIIASTPGHPILATCIESIGKYRNGKDTMHRTGPAFMTDCFLKAFCAGDNIDIALPPSFFYPVGYSYRHLPRLAKYQMIKPESFTIHYWNKAWFSAKSLLRAWCRKLLGADR